MSYAYRRHATVADYDDTHSQSTGDLPFSLHHYDEQQLVERGEASNYVGERHHHQQTERYHRPNLRDHRATTYDPSSDRRAIEWPGFGVESSLQVIQHDGSNYQSDQDDEPGDEHDDDHHRHDRTGHRPSNRNQEQPFPNDPLIARFVRSEAQRKSSSGRNFFSPAGLQDSQKAVTRLGAVEFPLLPMPTQHTPDSLSHTAVEFAHIGSGKLQKCVKFLRENECLLREDYHPYIQEAWIALWDDEKNYAHQCLSRWYLLDECRRIRRPTDIGRHVNQRGFSGDRFMDKVDAMYDTLKDLRQRILHERKQAARRGLVEGSCRDNNVASSAWSFKGVQGLFQGFDRAAVLGNVGTVYRFVTEARREFQGNKREVNIQI